MMAITFRFANNDEYPVISKFLNDYWAENHIYCRDKDLFDWTFRENNNWDQDGYCFALAENDGELVGILGGIPFLFNEYGKTSPGVWIANYVIRPDHRRGTLALQLLSQFRKPPYNTVIASGINPATITIYKVLRGEVLPYMPRHFAVLPGRTERMENLLRIACPDRDAEWVRGLASAFEVKPPPVDPAHVGREIPAQWDTVDWPEIGGSTVGAARDRGYLVWRYLKHPTFEYRVIAIPDGSRTGLLIWRLETIRRTSDNGLVEVDRIGRVVEFLPASRANCEALLGALFQDLEAAGAFAADYYGFHGETREWLDAAGFPQTSIHPDGSTVPSRFQPLDGKGGGILSAMFRDPSTPGCGIESDCAWYWTKSDSDQDRPN